MTLVINTNISSLNVQNNLAQSRVDLATSLQRLSTGLRINNALDDAAGLAISERMAMQIRGLNQAARNTNDGVSLAQTAESALSSASTIFQRVRELAVQSANATNNDSDRAALQSEVDELSEELTHIVQTTHFNGGNLLDGSFGTATFQVGADSGETIEAIMPHFDAEEYTLNQTRSIHLKSSFFNSWPGSDIDFEIQGKQNRTIEVEEDDTARDVAAKINAVSSSTGVIATAETLIEVDFSSADEHTLEVFSNNTEAETVTFSTLGGMNAAVEAFNAVTSVTGITATVSDREDTLWLHNPSGENIGIGKSSVSHIVLLSEAGTTQLSSTRLVATLKGHITLQSVEPFTIDGDPGPAGTVYFNENQASALTTLALELDISTASAATETLLATDIQIDWLNEERAKLGALQSRFESAVSNIRTAAENLTAARSRIQDADFAVETANLTRAQIMQQAGTAMLSQANAAPQSVLILLRGLS